MQPLRLRLVRPLLLLVVMGLSAFNTPQYPQAFPIEGLTLKWFGELYGDRGLMEGLKSSLIIGAMVVSLSVPLGLAGALVMSQVYARARGLYYLVVVSPVLTPGVIIGIPTATFCASSRRMAGFREG